MQAHLIIIILLIQIVRNFAVERILHFRSVQFVQEFVVNAGFPLVTLQACNRCVVVIQIAGDTLL